MRYHFVDGPWAGVVVSADYMPHTVVLRGPKPDLPGPGGMTMLNSGEFVHTYLLAAAASERSDLAYFEYKGAEAVG